VRVVSLHPDVLVATSRIWQTTCTIVRAEQSDSHPTSGAASTGGAPAGGETFVIDSPVLPDELEILPALLEQSRFPPLSGLLVTHADWDHLLGRLAFPAAALGCPRSSSERMAANPGTAQRELRTFDEQHYVTRTKPLTLGAVQALDVPGKCEIGRQKLEFHAAEGHTVDGMAVWVPWARVLVAGDYLSAVEIPVLGDGGSIQAYVDTLERLRPLVASAEHVVAGHGPVLASERAAAVLEEDLAYLRALSDRGEAAELPPRRRTKAQRQIHAENVPRAAR
jgi:glyoxylase-like metal-dependent hydrolase (beta-lactamase superfamily II)